MSSSSSFSSKQQPNLIDLSRDDDTDTNMSGAASSSSASSSTTGAGTPLSMPQSIFATPPTINRSNSSSSSSSTFDLTSSASYPALSPSSSSGAIHAQQQIHQFQSFLASQSAATLTRLAPQLQSLEQQIHSVLIPIATKDGMINVPVASSNNNSKRMRDVHTVDDDEEEGEVVPQPAPTRHVLTSKPALKSNELPTLAFGSLAAASSSSSSSPSTYAPPHPAALHAASSIPAAASSSSSSSSSAASISANDAEMLSDEQLVARMQAEERASAEAARRARSEAADREFQEFLQREGTCAVCKSHVGADEALVQICEDAPERRAKGQHACEHKVCQTCLREYLQHILTRMANPTSASIVAPSSSAAPALVKSASLLTESDLVCPASGCSTLLQQWQMKRVLPPHDFEMLLSYTFKNTLKDSSRNQQGTRYVSCPNASCQNSFEGVPGTGVASSSLANANETGLDGQPMSAASKIHRSRNRFRCNECGTIFCGECGTTPYHDGFNCDEWKKYQTAKKCRFCDRSLTSANLASSVVAHHQPLSRVVSLIGGVAGHVAGFFGGSSSSSSAAASSSSSSSSSSSASSPALADVCNSAECLEKRAHSCERTLACGHYCGGIRGEAQRDCLVCLHEECPAHVASGVESNTDDYCGICFVEGLGQAPSIQLGCGHIMHSACISQKLDKRWPGARITFGFLCCPLCKKELSHPSLTARLAPLLQLKATILAKAVQRLTIEGMDKDDAFMLPTGRYYQQKENYAMDRFAYYMCSKCGVPYFGGQRRCEEAAQANAGEEKFQAEHLVCGGCTAGSDTKNCAKHGKEFIENKCRFCCNIATWYCWGSTHFCHECHRKQTEGDYVSRKPIADLPKCPGPDKCPIGIKHPPAGTEYSLGCGICRHAAASA